MATKTITKGSETVDRLTNCPYCDTDLSDSKPTAHLPCEQTPTTDEVIAALEELGVRP
jgi:hypothetical protein